MIEQRDVVPAIATALRAFYLLPSNVALFGSACRVAEEAVPTDPPWNLRTDPPLVTVHDDGGRVQYPILRDPTIRITVRGRGVHTVKRVAARADGYLRANVPVGIACIRRNSGSAFLVTRDESTGGADVASFTFAAVVPTIETV